MKMEKQHGTFFLLARALFTFTFALFPLYHTIDFVFYILGLLQEMEGNEMPR